MKRREFFQRSGMVLVGLAASRFLTACGNEERGTSVIPASSSFSVNSSVDQGHQHAVSFRDTDLSAPPAAGVVYTTSIPLAAYIDNHTHTVSITSQQLTDINNGLIVTITSSPTCVDTSVPR
jgi:hypothetical protein